MEYSETGLTLTKGFEAPGGVPVLTAYKDIAGVWTNGFGNTHGVIPGSTITVDQANADLVRNVQEAVNAVNRLVKVNLNQNRFDALVDFTYNLGQGSLATSTLLRLLNQSDYDGAANQFLRWNLAGGKPVAGLTRRRQAEHDLFTNDS